MSNLRDLQRNDMKYCRDDWWIPVILIDPDKTIYSTAKGTTDSLLGDVRKESKSFDEETGMEVLVKKLTITIRLADLERVPAENETWFIKYPDDLTDSGAMIQAAFTPNNVDVGGDSLGYIKIIPQEADITT